MKKISFDISNENNTDINFSQLLRIDEEGLLPGSREAIATCGSVVSPDKISEPTQFQFAQISDQTSLANLALKSDGISLVYYLADNNHLLTASQGKEGPPVFSVLLDESGKYIFTLHEHIDRPTPVNLVKSQQELGWHIQTGAEKFTATQLVHTEPLTAYQLIFNFSPQKLTNEFADTHKIQILWDNQVIYTLDPQFLEAKGYTFSVEGNPDKNATRLQFISDHDNGLMNAHLDQLSVTSTALNQLPLNFTVIGEGTLQDFSVNVTTTPALQLSNQIPFDVIVEQGVYQTIIVNDQHQGLYPLNTLLLEPLFNNLSISAANRMVEVVQRLEDNGQATNVYEIKITDKASSIPPITIADVQLSFPGGNGGLAVFKQNILIDDGSDQIPLPHHFI